jgi:acyl-CoA thioesterase I
MPAEYHRPVVRRIALVVAAVVVLFLAYRLLAPRAVTNSQPSGEAVVCFGDSLTAGTGAEPADSYPAQLERLIGRAVVNAGVPGDTTATALDRLERDVLARNPRVVLITLGGNDLIHGVAPEEAFANLGRIVDAIHRRGALVVVGGIELPLVDRGYGQGYEELRERTGCLLVENVLDGLLGHPDLMSDQIHPNSKGYAIMAKRFRHAIDPYL